MPFLRSDLHLSYAIASLHFSAFAFGAVIAGSLSDRFMRRYGRRAAIWCAGLGMAGGAVLLALAPVADGTILGVFVVGVRGNILLIAAQASLTSSHGARSHIALTEANLAASAFATLAAPTVGLVTASSLGWRVALLPAVALLILLALCFRHTRFGSGSRQQPAGTSMSVQSSERPLPPRYWAFWCLLTFETGVEWCIAYWGTSFLATQGHFSASSAATAMSAYFLAVLAGRYLGSRLARAVPALTLLGDALCVAAIGLPLFWLAPSPALHITGLFMLGPGLANVYPLGIALAARTTPRQAD